MNLKGKKLLIIAGADVHNKVVETAKSMGIYTIVTDYLEPSKSPAKLIADEFWMIDIMDTDAIVGKCKEEKIDGVLAFCIDPAQKPYQEVCEKLNLPCYGTKEQFEILTDKRRFKDFCIKHNVSVIPEYSLDDINNNCVTYPILIKPNITRGSRGQTVCYSVDQVKEAIEIAKHESADGEYLIERYLEGMQDMSFAYMIIDKQPHLLKLGDRILGKKQDNLDRQQIATILPSIHADDYVSLVEPKVKNMIDALGLEFGAVFLQGFWDEDTKDVYMYDPGLRFPGGDYDRVLKVATGFDNVKAFIEFALTGNTKSCYGNPIDAYKLNDHACVILSIAAHPGIIKNIKGVDIIKDNEHVYSLSQRYVSGEEVPEAGDIRQRVAEIVAYLPSRDDIRDFIEYIYETFHIEDEKGEDMSISKITLNNF